VTLVNVPLTAADKLITLITISLSLSLSPRNFVIPFTYIQRDIAIASVKTFHSEKDVQRIYRSEKSKEPNTDGQTDGRAGGGRAAIDGTVIVSGEREIALARNEKICALRLGVISSFSRCTSTACTNAPTRPEKLPLYRRDARSDDPQSEVTYYGFNRG